MVPQVLVHDLTSPGAFSPKVDDLSNFRAVAVMRSRIRRIICRKSKEPESENNETKFKKALQNVHHESCINLKIISVS